MIRNSVAAQHALPWGAVLKYNFIRINHNLHDFSVIHSHLKLNFIDAWREPSLRVVHCQWTSWAGGGKEGGWGAGYTSEWWLFFFFGRLWNKWQKNTTWYVTFCFMCVFKRTTWKEIIHIHHQVLTTQNLHNMSMRSDQFKETIKQKQRCNINNSIEWKRHIMLIFYNLSPPNNNKKIHPNKNKLPSHPRWNQTNEKCWRQWQWTEVRTRSVHTRGVN